MPAALAWAALCQKQTYPLSIIWHRGSAKVASNAVPVLLRQVSSCGPLLAMNMRCRCRSRRGHCFKDT